MIVKLVNIFFVGGYSFEHVLKQIFYMLEFVWLNLYGL